MSAHSTSVSGSSTIDVTVVAKNGVRVGVESGPHVIARSMHGEQRAGGEG